MDLARIGATGLKPETVFFWNPKHNATVEVTELLGGQRLVQASKSYRLVSQDAEGQESWDRNLPQLNKELASTFSSFRISVDYTDSVTSEVLGFDKEAEELVGEADELRQRSKELQQRRERLETGIETGFDGLQHRLEDEHREIVEEEEQVNTRLEEILAYLENRKHQLNQWRENGVSTAYLFQFSTDPELIPETRLDEIIERHLDEVYDRHRRQVKQTLQGPKFKLNVRELQEPRILNRMEHTQLLNPEGFDHLISQAGAEVQEQLKKLQRMNARQYMALALDDVEADERTIQREKSTPARAVSSLLQELEITAGTHAEDAPNTGPMLGKVVGSEQVYGFDPAEIPHYYIAGGTGSGKSYLKRVLLENIASLGYDAVSISPSDREEIGLSLPNPDHEDGTGLAANQYYLGSDKLLDRPEDICELFSGINAVTLERLPESRKHGFVDDVFNELAELNRMENPLFVFLEEAHNFSDGDTADVIQDLVREGRKFGIHVVISSQSPMDFSRNHKHVRENTVPVFLNGEYFDYADNFLDDKKEIQELETGQAMIISRDFPKLKIDVRKALTKPTTPTDQEIREIDQRYNPNVPDLSGSTPTAKSETGEQVELSLDEQKLLDYIKKYIRENDERPSKSKCYRPSDAPFGSSKTSRLLDQLLEKDKITEDTVERYGNESQVYSPD